MLGTVTTFEIGAFKHAIVPLGVIIGLGVAFVVTAVSGYVEHRKTIRFSLAHAVWTLVLFLLFIIMWWSIWEFRQVPAGRWTLSTLLLLMCGPAILYLGSVLLLPTTRHTVDIDLAARMDGVGRLVFLCILGTLAWAVSIELFLLDQAFLSRHRLNQGIICVLLLLAIALPGRRAALVIGILFLAMIVLAVFTVRAQLG